MDEILLLHFENKESNKVENVSKFDVVNLNFSIKDSLWFNVNDPETEPEQNFMHLKHKADYLYSIGNYDKAKDIFMKIKNLVVPDLIVRCCNIDLINCLIHLHEFMDAKILLFELMRSCTNHDQVIEGLMLMRNLYCQSGDIPSGIITLKKLLLLVGDVTENWIFLADLYLDCYKLRLKTAENKTRMVETYGPKKNIDTIENENVWGSNEKFNLPSVKDLSINDGINSSAMINHMVKCIEEEINMEKTELMPHTIAHKMNINYCKLQCCTSVEVKDATNVIITNDSLLNINHYFEAEHKNSKKCNYRNDSLNPGDIWSYSSIKEQNLVNDSTITNNLENINFNHPVHANCSPNINNGDIDSIKFNCHHNGKDIKCTKNFSEALIIANNDAHNYKYLNVDCVGQNLFISDSAINHSINHKCIDSRSSFERLEIDSDTTFETSLNGYFDIFSEIVIDELKSWICYVISYSLLNKNSKINSSFTNVINIRQIEKVKEKLDCFKKISPFQHFLLEDVYKHKNAKKEIAPIHKIILASNDNEVEALFDCKYFSLIERMLKIK